MYYNTYSSTLSIFGSTLFLYICMKKLHIPMSYKLMFTDQNKHMSLMSICDCPKHAARVTLIVHTKHTVVSVLV